MSCPNLKNNGPKGSLAESRKNNTCSQFPFQSFAGLLLSPTGLNVMRQKGLHECFLNDNNPWLCEIHDNFNEDDLTRGHNWAVYVCLCMCVCVCVSMCVLISLHILLCIEHTIAYTGKFSSDTWLVSSNLTCHLSEQDTWQSCVSKSGS